MIVETLSLGGVQLTILKVVPGEPGEGRRVRETLKELDPNVVACDCDMEAALELRRAAAARRTPKPDWVARAYAKASAARRPATPDDSALLGAAQGARDRDASLVPLLPPSKRPGLFRRVSLARSLSRPLEGADPAERATEFDARVRAIPDLAETEDASDRAAVSRLRELLFKEQATRIVAVLAAPRAKRVAARLRVPPPKGEMARIAQDPENRPRRRE